MTLGQLLADCTRRLTRAGVSFGHGTTCAADEAAWLLLWSLKLPLDSDLHALQQQAITPAQQARVNALLEQRISTRKPLAYLTQEAWLQTIPFYVDERSIVPRSLIAEILATGSVDEWLSENTRQVLDLCTGNASLACLAAMAWPQVHVTASDISAEALAVARKNVARHQLEERVTLVQSDGLAGLRGPWDLIICNPPYVNSRSMAALPPEYRAEPLIALAGGADGMDFIRCLLGSAAACMTEEAILLLEIGNERDHFEAAFPHLPVVWQETTAGSDQVVLLPRTALTHFYKYNPQYIG